MIWQLAKQYDISGKVLNTAHGVVVIACGKADNREKFIQDIPQSLPPLAQIEQLQISDYPATDFAGFQIVASEGGSLQTRIGADAAVCSACRDDCLEPENRRYYYPFTNCTHCGPRLSIIQKMPYDRCHTSMSGFELCPACLAEYQSADNRRFHAQANACADCGPHIWLESGRPGDDICSVQEQIKQTANNNKKIIELMAQWLKQGKILAVKGLGGFHLVCDASHPGVVASLRQRKQRPAKPFALMAKDVDMIARYCHINEDEKKYLQSAAAPIVLLQRKKTRYRSLPEVLAPGQATLGFMLPHTPLHVLLFEHVDRPLVMTSGNISSDPQCYDNQQAREKLAYLADILVMHNRDIVHRVDDSVVRVYNRQLQFLRRSRGYAPTIIPLPDGFEQNRLQILACGGELKNTLCLLKDNQAVVSQYIGDLENPSTLADYEATLKSYQEIYQLKPDYIAIDQHPEYLSSKLGRQLAQQYQIPAVEIQHHHAHLAACLAENQWGRYQGKVLAICLDGLGYGADQSLWGGEFLLADYSSCDRLASFQPIPMPGGTQAILEPWRNLYAHLHQHQLWQPLKAQYQGLPIIDFLSQKPLATLDQMIAKKFNSPRSSSCGRLFDAVAASLGLCSQKIEYEAQAAIAMENLLDETLLRQQQVHAYTLELNDRHQITTARLWPQIFHDLAQKTDIAIIASRFFLALVQIIETTITRLLGLNHSSHKTNAGAKTQTIVFSGGVFQHRYLAHWLKERLEKYHLQILQHRQLPANDANIALGQAFVCLAQHNSKEK